VISANIKNFKYKYYWQKTQSVGFLNAKKQPLRNIEEIAVFYRKQPTYNPQMWKSDKLSHGATKRTYVANKSKVYGDNSKDCVYVPTFDRYPTQLLTYKNEKQTSSLHPTQKPVALLENLIKTFTNEGDTVLDFCMGSGSCGVACKNLNRNFIGIELDENYYKIAKERIENA
jgi:site-specific DNA-methyltransferase (adenine-specific)